MKVIDAGALVDLLIDLTGKRVSVRANLHQSSVHAPSLVDAEVLSTLRKARLRGQLSDASLADAIFKYLEVPLFRKESVDLFLDSLKHIHNVSAYDALYVALAEDLGCSLVTTDKRLASAPGINCEVITIA